MKNDAPGRRSYGGPWPYWMIGLGSFIWLIPRSGDNPRRLAHPCQRAALAGVAGFLVHLASLPGMAWLYRGIKRKATPAGGGLLVLAALFSAVLKGGSAPTPAPRGRHAIRLDQRLRGVQRVRCDGRSHARVRPRWGAIAGRPSLQ